MVFMYLLYINSKTTQSNNWIGYCHRLPNAHLCVVTCTGINKYKAGKTTFIEFLCLGWEKNYFYSQFFIFSLLLRQQMFPIPRNHRISHTLCICIFLPLTIDTKCSCTQNSPPAPLLFNYYNHLMVLFTQIKLTSKCIFFSQVLL